jgi:aryl-alcohol dehydrogenase-like predicted oxidoreductase
MGLGGGGPSRLGISTSQSKQESIKVIHRALEMGVNFFDTAESYETEEFFGEGLTDVPRESVFISTKCGNFREGGAKSLRESLEKSLSRLKTDYVDVYSLHGLRPEELERAEREILPEMKNLRDEGKIRFIGVTEAFEADTTHEMLKRSVPTGEWDVVMVGYNMINQTGRDCVFPITMKQQIGTQIMFAVRRALSRQERLKEVVDELAKAGQIDPDFAALSQPLGFLEAPGVARSVVEAAYRFCLHEPGCDIILTGTGNVEHLEANLACANMPPLPEAVQQRLRQLFGRVDSVCGN